MRIHLWRGLQAVILGSTLAAMTAVSAQARHGDNDNNSSRQERSDSNRGNDRPSFQRQEPQRQNFSRPDFTPRNDNRQSDFNRQNFDRSHADRSNFNRQNFDRQNFDRGRPDRQTVDHSRFGSDFNRDGPARDFNHDRNVDRSGQFDRNHRGEDRNMRTWHGTPPGDARVHQHDVHRFADRDVNRFNSHDRDLWEHGNWHHGRHHDRDGWWWFTGGLWYFYAQPIYPFPLYVSDYYADDDYPSNNGDYWYYCRHPRGYYPYVQYCDTDWEMVPASPYGNNYYDQGPGPDDYYDNGY